MVYLAPMLCALFGIALLNRSWRRATAHRSATTTVGWLLLAGSLAAWVVVAGVEFGPVFAILAVPFLAWLFVGAGIESRQRPSSTPTRRPMQKIEWSRLFEHAGLFSTAILLAGVAAALLAAALIRWLPGAEADRMALAVLLMPVLWGTLSVWICATEQRLRTCTLVSGLGIAGGLLAAAG